MEERCFLYAHFLTLVPVPYTDCWLSDLLVCILYVVLSAKAASIAGMCIMPDEFKGRLSDYGQYCPVSLADNELVDCSSYNRLTYAAEFQGNSRLL